VTCTPACVRLLGPDPCPVCALPLLITPNNPKGYLSISFNDTYYQLAATPGRNAGVPPLSEAQLAALQAFRCGFL
jgi:hypothetical protein